MAGRGREGLLEEADPALATLEASLVPVEVAVAQVPTLESCDINHCMVSPGYTNITHLSACCTSDTWRQSVTRNTADTWVAGQSARISGRSAWCHNASSCRDDSDNSDHDDDSDDSDDHDSVPCLSPEVAGVPVPAHGPGVSPGEDQLIAGPAPGLHLLGVMSLTEHLVLVHTVGQVH